MTNWKELLICAGAVISNLEMYPKDLDLLKEFHDGFGSEEGAPFTAWDEKWVYFPVCYDGSEWVGRVPRNPSEIITRHIGG